MIIYSFYENLLLCSFLCLGSTVYSQVGINTEHPQTSLDVNGDLLLRGELKFGTDSGIAGQVLTSQGTDQPPKWANYELQVLETGDYVLINVKILSDSVGLVLNNGYTTIVDYDDQLTAEWTVLEGVSSNITIKEDENRVIYTFQTVLQSPYSGTTGLASNNYLNVLCGVFIGKKGENRSTYKLTTVREGVVKGNHYPQLGFTIIASSSDVLPGEYEILFAFQRRGGSASLSSLPLYIGRGFDTGLSYNVSNNFMNKTASRVDVFEPNKK